jgi:Peptidase family S41
MRVLAVLMAASMLFAPALLAQTPAAPTEAPRTQIDPRTLAANLATRLESGFVYPDQGKRYAAALRANAASGAYDGLKGVELARKLGEDLQSVARDGHLRVMFEGVGGGGGPQIVIKRPPDATGAGPSPQRAPVMVRMTPPPEIEHAGWIAPGIAFIRFNLFPGSSATTEAAQRFMAAHARAKTIIFDVRTHRGGGLAEIDAIFPWLFPAPTRLVTMATRKSVDEAGGSPIAGVPTLRVVEADPNFVTREHWVTPGRDRRLAKAKVYVLTSGFSASAAEHFALALKGTGRATLVGRTTYGANHFGGDQDLGGGYTAFIPVGRAYDPVTGKDWEGTGITPDVDVAPEDALTQALTLSGVTPIRAARLSTRVAPAGRMMARN